MRKTDLAYIAGIIDGEGSICLIKNKRSMRRYETLLQVTVASTNQWLIEWLRFAWGGSIYREDPQAPKLGNKPIYRWVLRYRRVATLLEAIVPYLRLKRSKAELALLFQSRKRPYAAQSEEQRALEEADRILIREME